MIFVDGDVALQCFQRYCIAFNEIDQLRDNLLNALSEAIPLFKNLKPLFFRERTEFILLKNMSLVPPPLPKEQTMQAD